MNVLNYDRFRPDVIIPKKHVDRNPLRHWTTVPNFEINSISTLSVCLFTSTGINLNNTNQMCGAFNYPVECIRKHQEGMFCFFLLLIIFALLTILFFCSMYYSSFPWLKYTLCSETEKWTKIWNLIFEIDHDYYIWIQ